jgi:hypothetical protein
MTLARREGEIVPTPSVKVDPDRSTSGIWRMTSEGTSMLGFLGGGKQDDRRVSGSCLDLNMLGEKRERNAHVELNV